MNQVTMQLELIHGDRRADTRYELELDLRFSYQHRGETHWGVGWTAELSGGGVCFRTNSPPPTGVEAELRIHWPFLLQNILPLQLEMRGTIIRTDSKGTVLKVRSYAFRTCGEHSFDLAIPPERSYSITA
jgi:hypothetical protein